MQPFLRKHLGFRDSMENKASSIFLLVLDQSVKQPPYPKVISIPKARENSLVFPTMHASSLNTFSPDGRKSQCLKKRFAAFFTCVFSVVSPRSERKIVHQFVAVYLGL